jgi:UDP-N-acetylmuramoyl-L-alanyl-D-glutamate--2,6-diaminopimelate ligase
MIEDAGSSSNLYYKPMQLLKLIEGLEIEAVRGETSIDIKGISHNSKDIGKDYLFVALKGSQKDGHRYLNHAISAGARAVIVEEDQYLRKGIPLIKVPDTRIALGKISDCFYQSPSRELKVIGITGTNGKTTISYLLESIFKAAGYHPGVVGTIEYRFGRHHQTAFTTTPDALDLQRIMREMVDDNVTHLVLEVSSHALQQHRVEGVNFDVVVFTNLTAEHLDYHESMESYSTAKELLFTHYLNQSSKKKPYAVINYDDPLGKSFSTATAAQSFRYGIKGEVDITVKDSQLGSDGLSALITTPRGEITVHSSLLGVFNLSNILAAVGVAITQDIPLDVITKGIANLKTVPGRLEKIENEAGLTILVDYAHTSDALDNVLTTLRDLCQRRLITVFGCGGDRDKTKRGPMGNIATSKSDLSIITFDNPRTEDPMAIMEQIEAGIDRAMVKKYRVQELKGANHSKGYLAIPDRKEAIRTAVNLVEPGDILLISGKGHEDYQIIGSKRHHFSDKEEVLEALTLRAAKGGVT